MWGSVLGCELQLRARGFIVVVKATQFDKHEFFFAVYNFCSCHVKTRSSF